MALTDPNHQFYTFALENPHYFDALDRGWKKEDANALNIAMKTEEEERNKEQAALVKKYLGQVNEVLELSEKKIKNGLSREIELDCETGAILWQ